MRPYRLVLTALLVAPGLFFGCSGSPPADEHVVPEEPTASEARAPEDATTPVTSPQESAPAGTSTTEVPASPEPLTQDEPATQAGPVAPEAAKAVIAVVGKAGATRIGADKCKMCHKVQYSSWAESAHARQSPVLDCESCHGPGSQYKSIAVMKDPAKAREAGLVMPDPSFCTESCHAADWKDDMLGRAHAHKNETL